MWTILQFITAARILLNDNKEPYRYTDDRLKLALDIAVDEARRARPDMFIRNDFPIAITSASDVAFPVPLGYKSAFVFYVAGWTQLQDEEDVTDQRASAFISKFTSQLMTAV